MQKFAGVTYTALFSIRRFLPETDGLEESWILNFISPAYVYSDALSG